METKVKKYRLVNTEGYHLCGDEPTDLVFGETYIFGDLPVSYYAEFHPNDWEEVKEESEELVVLPIRGQLIQVRDSELGAWRTNVFDRFDEGGRVWCFSSVEFSEVLIEGRLPNSALTYGWNHWRFVEWDE